MWDWMLGGGCLVVMVALLWWPEIQQARARYEATHGHNE